MHMPLPHVCHRVSLQSITSQGKKKKAEKVPSDMVTECVCFPVECAINAFRKLILLLSSFNKATWHHGYMCYSAIVNAHVQVRVHAPDEGPRVLLFLPPAPAVCTIHDMDGSAD